MILSISIDFQWQDLGVSRYTEASLALPDAFKRYIDMAITEKSEGLLSQGTRLSGA